MLRGFLSQAVFLLVLAAASGCARESTVLNSGESAPVLEHGWTTYDCSADGFKLSAPAVLKTSLPSTVTAGAYFDPDAPTPSAPLVDTSPKEVPYRVGKKDRERGTVLKLYDQNSLPLPGEEPAGLYVKCQTVGSANLQQAVARDRDQERGIVEDRDVTLPIGPAHFFLTTRQTISGSTVTTFIYVVANRRRLYHFRFQTVNAPESLRPYVEPVMNTLRVTE